MSQKQVLVAAGALLALLAADFADAAALGQSHFFATREACRASGAFHKRDCDVAFANAETELRDRAPTFPSRAECRLKFHYCEARRLAGEGEEAETVGFSPLALGVEMVAAPRGVEAAPVLAVETPPSLFPHYPISRQYVARDKAPASDAALAYNAILPADRFAPFPRNSAVSAIAKFVPAAPAAEEEVPVNVASHEETPEERRARLKNAPFVE